VLPGDGGGSAANGGGPFACIRECREVWHIIKDPGTAVAAMQNKEMDWWENPTNDMLPMLRQGTQVRIIDPTGLIPCMRHQRAMATVR
jgi:peptide/nickel transport system substrate-binding protein